MDKPKISVIVPVYNIEKYIERCLQSIVSQTFKAIEIIVINDGATDDSSEIIYQFAKTDKRIVVINKANGGLSSARNAGIAIAQGEYLLHVDGDDWIEPNYLRDMYERAVRDDLDVVISNYIKDYDNGATSQVADLPIGNEQIIDGSIWLDNFFERKATQSMFNKLFRTSLYKDNAIEHPLEVSVGEDLATTPRLMHYTNRVGKINKCYYHYIQRASSLTNSISAASTDKSLVSLMRAFDVLREFFDFSPGIVDKIAKHRIAQIAIFVFTPNVDRDSAAMNKLSIEYLEANSRGGITYSTRRITHYSYVLKMLPHKNMVTIMQYANNLLYAVWKKLRRY